MPDKYVKQIVLPKKNSHKGENGRVLVIGGSRLFHAASFWSACMAAKIVDMVHFSSPAVENNELMRVRAKSKFWEGIVVPWEEVGHYIEEDDAILIGPGMERGEETKQIVNGLLRKYQDKKWVVDGGALQEVDPRLLNKNMIVTPNLREREILGDKIPKGVTVLSKGPVDIVSDGEEKVKIEGESAGMTKGGTGDVLAGLVSALYAKSPAFAACVVASRANKRAGEKLEKRVGTFFSAAELIPETQKVLGEITKNGSLEDYSEFSFVRRVWSNLRKAGRA
ncbi:MAG: ADP/ATP-dependent (S)-NAD(P)H-hydrate dehydratase [bacterium]